MLPTSGLCAFLAVQPPDDQDHFGIEFSQARTRMKKSRFAEEKILPILKKLEAGERPAASVVRKHDAGATGTRAATCSAGSSRRGWAIVVASRLCTWREVTAWKLTPDPL